MAKTYKLSNHDINKFIFLFRKVIYPYEYMYERKKFKETSLPEKKDFYNHLNMEDITSAKYTHTKIVCKDFKIKNLCSKWYNINILFNSFWTKSPGITGLDPAHFISAPGPTSQEALKKTKEKLDLLNNIDMLLMVENCIRGGICHAIHQCAKANVK